MSSLMMLALRFQLHVCCGCLPGLAWLAVAAMAVAAVVEAGSAWGCLESYFEILGSAWRQGTGRNIMAWDMEHET